MLRHLDWLNALRASSAMVAILVCGMLTAGYALERMIYFALRCENPGAALAAALTAVRAGNREEAIRVLSACPHPLGQVAAEMLRTPDPSPEATQEKIRIALSAWRMELERHLGFIGTVGKMTPLIGLLGTVWGIMGALHGMARPGPAVPSLLASGVAEALLPTAAGLLVALPALVVSNYFTRHVGVLLTVAENHTRTLRLEAEAARSGRRPGDRAA